ncbi:MAG: SLOG family protein [Candidatus Cloacimonadota bacterium]|nr:SLOG family protein [Candidatus Cloacimonadota bacterium]
MKLAVIGTKKFTDFNFLSITLKKIFNIEMIISGGAPGTDTLAKKYAIHNKIEFLEFPPDYKKFGDKAKHFRDKLIAKECDELIAFWDGECEGTKYTMDYAKQLEKPVNIILVMIT